MNLDDAPGPRMPRIENLAIFDPVGVPLSRSTTRSDRTERLGNRTPMQVWRAGTTGALGETTVDMTLVLRTSLDNADALPTCPQPPQQ